ncbi:hypothetical protein DR950_41760 [Kitasatospora xanthocidica]|uniref:Uncharacterized protein n=1 Tax=Kitasatospora xanthocidica TaxID=83382 RepID=A0A372ZIQ8_9ACTN|nr:hypothetical protein [Kitasatospora xanthocidica]RGD55392.1 hypothetical protein DR950_41760 [Kitasatospora xanthocidica]
MRAWRWRLREMERERLRRAGQAPPTLRQLLPALVALALAVVLGTCWLTWSAQLLGIVGLVLGAGLYAWVLAYLVRLRGAAVRRRRGRYTPAEAERLTDDQVPGVVLTLLRRDGWQVASAPYQGQPRILGTRAGREIDVCFRASDWEEDTATSGPGPAPLRAAGTVGYGGVVRLIVSLGTFSRGDVLWASRQGGLHLVDGDLLRRWATGERVHRLLGIVA